jgi:hypothetical protein
MLGTREGYQSFVWCVLFSPDGKTLASCGQDDWVHPNDVWIRLHDVRTGRTIRRLHAGLNGAGPLAFSPDGKVLASAGWNTAVRLWDCASGKVLRELPGHPGNGRSCLDFSPDGKMLASSGPDGIVRLWEVFTGKERRSLRGHQGGVCSVAFSPDGRTLASGGADTTALAWEVFATDLTGPARPVPITPRGLDALWGELAGADAARAYDALCAVVHARGGALPFLQERLRPAEPADARRVARLLEDLDDDRFPVRQKARRGLEGLGEEAEPLLRKALTGGPSPEVRRRVGELLDKLRPDVSPERLGALRALEALEHWGTPEAHEVLRKLAQGAPEARLTLEAKASLQRLARQPVRTR